MITLQLDMYQACALGALVYCLGRLMVNKLSFLSKYCIPAPVAGGIVFAFAHLALYAAGILELSFDTTLQSVFMTVFFCSVGFTACFRLLKKGGLQVFLFLGLAVAICVIQDAVGSGLAAAFGLDPLLGLCMGSMPLVGGHGTSGSFGPLLETDYAVVGATTVALAAATYGLVSGSMMGGPIARARVEKLHLKSTAAEEGNETAEVMPAVDGQKFTTSAMFLAVAIGLGTLIFTFFKDVCHLTFPTYIGAMLAAAAIRNIWDVQHKELPMVEIDALGGLSLNLFLSMVQTIVMFLYANFVVFNVMGRDYEAAAMTTAFCGFGMGATPNAMANMRALVERYGAAPRAFFIVPLVGSLFVDFFNSMVLTTFMNFL